MAATLTKGEVNYRLAATSERRCGNCSMFRPIVGRCTLVKGHIEKQMVCDRWESK